MTTADFIAHTHRESLYEHCLWSLYLLVSRFVASEKRPDNMISCTFVLLFFA